MKTRACLLLIAVLLLPAFAQAAGPITLETLLDEMIDRTAVARFPDPAYTCKQASSYDQHSTEPDEPGWFANNDRSYFLRSEEINGRKEWVMMDAKGPGAIVRFWVTSGAYKGKVRVYLDGSDTPAVEARVDELVGGQALVGKPLSEETARGRNLYLPIPYAKQCKVTFDRPNFQESHDRNDLLYYQINYRTYAAGADVKSYSKEQLDAASEKIAQVQKTLLNPAGVLPKGSSEAGDGSETKTIAHREVLAAHLKGPAAVCQISVRLDAEDRAQALRSTVLVIETRQGQTVWCPVGDFFGSGVGVNPYTGWYRKVDKDGTMTCWWVMPYENSCSISLQNLGAKPVKATLGPIMTCPWKWDDRSMNFRANWRQEREIATAEGGKAAVDWNYITAQGKGVFVGDSLALVNRARGWWGEGDEKIYVDGEKFPSHFGTGTEDYYGYAWCTPKFFQSPFHAQPRAEGPHNFGNVTNTRVRLLDAIPFNESFQFDMEVWHWQRTEVDYAVTTYWYAEPGATAKKYDGPGEAVQPVRYNTPIVLPGYQVLSVTHGNLTVQQLAGFGRGKWSNDNHLWWTGAKPGAKLSLPVEVKTDGTYRVELKLTKANDYAIIQCYLDDKKVGEPIDLFDPAVVPTGPVSLGEHPLTAGQHKLTFEIVGANPKAKKSYMVGFDQIVLTPVE
ncbi:MAG: DUF2961 domain-containing protein [Pirellulales bacterium]|nr:DUF2961 domain-containing protein [Pirellulales bacterium]